MLFSRFRAQKLPITNYRSFEQQTDAAPLAAVCLFTCCGDTCLTDLLPPPVFSGSIYFAEDANKRIASYLTAPL